MEELKALHQVREIKSYYTDKSVTPILCYHTELKVLHPSCVITLN